MLFEPHHHEALCDAPWDESLACATIRSIVREIEQHRGIDGRWPMHPLDDEGDEPRTGFKSLYLGRAGDAWQLQGFEEIVVDQITIWISGGGGGSVTELAAPMDELP